MIARNLVRSILGQTRIGLADIGASGGLEPRWRPYARFIRPFFFEPDQRALDDLAEKSGCANPRIFPFALTERDENVTLHLCEKQTVSSLFKPNFTWLSRFPDVERFRIVRQVSVPSRALDNCLSEEERTSVDFLKLDVQGCELRVLEGARRTLSTPVIGLEVEVEFQELYQDQPLFGEICRELKIHGFELFDFTSISRWNRAGYSRFGQLAFADALFMRSPETFATLLVDYPQHLGREKCLKYVAICAMYERVDLIRVAAKVFSDFLSAADVAGIKKRLRLLEIRGYLVSRLFGVLFRGIFKPLGFNFLPFSNSVQS